MPDQVWCFVGRSHKISDTPTEAETLREESTMISINLFMSYRRLSYFMLLSKVHCREMSRHLHHAPTLERLNHPVNYQLPKPRRIAHVRAVRHVLLPLRYPPGGLMVIPPVRPMRGVTQKR